MKTRRDNDRRKKSNFRKRIVHIIANEASNGSIIESYLKGTKT